MPFRRLLLPLLLCLPLAATAAEAPAAPAPAYRQAAQVAESAVRVAPQAFNARYRLEVSGWPRTSVSQIKPTDGGKQMTQAQKEANLDTAIDLLMEKGFTMLEAVRVIATFCDLIEKGKPIETERTNAKEARYLDTI